MWQRKPGIKVMCEIIIAHKGWVIQKVPAIHAGGISDRDIGRNKNKNHQNI